VNIESTPFSIRTQISTFLNWVPWKVYRIFIRYTWGGEGRFGVILFQIKGKIDFLNLYGGAGRGHGGGGHWGGERIRLIYIHFWLVSRGHWYYFYMQIVIEELHVCFILLFLGKDNPEKIWNLAFQNVSKISFSKYIFLISFFATTFHIVFIEYFSKRTILETYSKNCSKKFIL